MKPILIDIDRLEVGSSPILVTSKNLENAQDLPAAVTPDGHIVSCWQFTEAEREAVARGADLYLFHRTSGNPVQPVSLVIGPEPVEAPV